MRLRLGGHIVFQELAIEAHGADDEPEAMFAEDSPLDFGVDVRAAWCGHVVIAAGDCAEADVACERSAQNPCASPDPWVHCVPELERVDFIECEVWQGFVEIPGSRYEDAGRDLDERPGDVRDRDVLLGDVEVELSDESVEPPALALDDVAEAWSVIDCARF